MYRNICYNPRDESVKLFTWDKQGNRIAVDTSYNPYVYIETSLKGDYTSLFNTSLKKKIFTDTRQRSRFIKDCGTKRIFENIRPEQQFLIDTYWEKNDREDFTQNKLKIHYIDIEVYCPDGFPSPEEAKEPINVITVYDSLEEKFYTWGTSPLDAKLDDDCTYIYCSDERELLIKWLDHTEKDHPDIISGWNSEFFDIPYLIIRIAKLLGDDEFKRLSPINNVYSRLLTGQFGKEQQKWYISGVSCLDYLDIYKKFSIGLRESYKLDAIAELELGEKKVDYGNTNLSALADEDWETFVRYNIQDVRLLVKMEDKLRYLELLRMLSYKGLTNLESAMGTLSVITGAAIIQAKHKGLVIPTFVKDSIRDGKYEGAYVGEPQRGFQEDIISFDANSLYPNTMITLNLSPETKVGKIVDRDDKTITVQHVNGKSFQLTHEKFMEFVERENISISKAKILFSQTKKGIMPEIVDKIYNDRVEIKKKLREIRLKLNKTKKDSKEYAKLKKKAGQLDINQFTLKILINTVYGYFGNKWAPIGDPDIARSITLTGQAVIKKSNDILREYIKENGINTEIDPIIYNDTDSSYISIKSLMSAREKEFNIGDDITDDAIEEAEKIESHLNEEIVKWANSTLNSKDCRFVFKREVMADTGMFLQKKRYVIRVLDDEGIPTNKFKYTGVEVVRSTMPAPIKPYVKKIIETMLVTKKYSDTNDIFLQAYDEFKDLPIEDYAFAMGISNYDKYADKCDGFHVCKGMPIHIKASYYYNTLVDKYNLQSSCEYITTGDKVRYFYVNQPNKYGINAIAYKYYFPDELKAIFEPDKELMFEKIIFSIVERFYESVNWKISKPSAQVQTDLFDLLGI